jgi:hypothetical protein
MPRGTTIFAALALVAACGPAAVDEPVVATPNVTSSQHKSGLPPPNEWFSEPAEYAAVVPSAEAGADYFGRTGVGDPYGAGFPYPIFVALMREYPDRLGSDWHEFSERFGTIPNVNAPDDPWALPVGFHLTTDPNTNVQFLMMNCQICHTDRIVTPTGTNIVVGMGSKTVRLHAYDRAVMDIARDDALTETRVVRGADAVASDRDMTWPADLRKVIVANTLRNLRERADKRGADVDRIGDGLPGRVASIEGFMMALNYQRDAGLTLPETTGWVKIPDVAVWRYRETNSYDGVTAGSPVALVAEADFTFGVRAKWYDEHRHIATSMFLFLRDFERDMPYPGDVDMAEAKRGYEAFEDSCAKCHGSYSKPGADRRVVSYTENLVSEDMIESDTARMDAVTAEFVDYANSIPEAAGLTVTRQTRSYVPRPLVGVWARGLYGHNGQWPSLAVMATMPADRPSKYIVDTAGQYDLMGVGRPWRPYREGDASGAGEYVYDGTVAGFGVGGHEFLAELSEQDRLAVIEYLKLL